jgi:hypothetical protein
VKRPGISDYKAFKDFIEFRWQNLDTSVIQIKKLQFEGQNFGYLQLTPPIPKPIKKVVAKKKLIQRKKKCPKK